MMKRWMQRVKLGNKNDYDPGAIIGNENYKITRKAGQGVKEDTVPQGVWYEVIYAGRHRQPSQLQYDKSYGDLVKKMGMELVAEEDTPGGSEELDR